MRVLMVEPGTAPYEMEINGLEEMQVAVGGRITASYPFEEQVALVSNEESIWLQMPFNRSVEGGYGGIFGPFFVCGIEGESFSSLTPEQMTRYREKYYQAEILLAVHGNEVETMKVEPRPKRGPEPPQQKSPRR